MRFSYGINRCRENLWYRRTQCFVSNPLIEINSFLHNRVVASFPIRQILQFHWWFFFFNQVPSVGWGTPRLRFASASFQYIPFPYVNDVRKSCLIFIRLSTELNVGSFSIVIEQQIVVCSWRREELINLIRKDLSENPVHTWMSIHSRQIYWGNQHRAI